MRWYLGLTVISSSTMLAWGDRNKGRGWNRVVRGCWYTYVRRPLPNIILPSKIAPFSVSLSLSLSLSLLLSHSDKHTNINTHRKPHQVLDELLQVIFGRLGLLLASNNGDHFWIVITRAVGKHHPGSKLITDLTDVSSTPSDQETMVLSLATDLYGVVLLSLRQRWREGGREGRRKRKTFKYNAMIGTHLHVFVSPWKQV